MSRHRAVCTECMLQVVFYFCPQVQTRPPTVLSFVCSSWDLCASRQKPQLTFKYLKCLISQLILTYKYYRILQTAHPRRGTTALSFRWQRRQGSGRAVISVEYQYNISIHFVQNVKCAEVRKKGKKKEKKNKRRGCCEILQAVGRTMVATLYVCHFRESIEKSQSQAREWSIWKYQRVFRSSIGVISSTGFFLFSSFSSFYRCKRRCAMPETQVTTSVTILTTFNRKEKKKRNKKRNKTTPINRYHETAPLLCMFRARAREGPLRNSWLSFLFSFDLFSSLFWYRD